MFKLIKKIRKSLLAAAIAVVVLSPAIAAASGESYYWQDTTRQQIEATGGSFTKTTDFTGSVPDFSTAPTIACTDGSGQATLGITVTSADYQAKSDQTPATLKSSCDTGIDSGSISIYSNLSSAQAATGSGSDNTSCKGGVLTWIICPIYNFILGSIRSIENDVIVPFLRISPITTNTNSPPYLIWSQFRNLADIGFIIIFLVIIFGHTLSFGIDNYSLKKALPRVVMAAILVQFSYVMVAFGVDVTNILGAGVQGLVLTPLKGHSTLVFNGLNEGIGVAVGIGAALAAAGSIITGGILVILFGAFFAVIAVFLTLVARQILVTLLLIISPLAFVAWILPNTENWFKLWRTSLVRLLLMYPMIVLLFAAGRLFSAAAIATTGGSPGGDTSNALLPLISVVASVIPLYFIPFTFKYAGSTMSSVSGWIGNLATTNKKRLESSEGYDRLKKRTQQRRTELSSGESVRGFGAITGTNSRVWNRAIAQTGRGAYNPSGYGSGANVRAMVSYNKSTNDWKKRLEEENMGYEGLTYLSRGEKWYQDKYDEINIKIADAQRNGNLNEMAVQQTNLTKHVSGKSSAQPYSGNASARAGAFLKLTEFDVTEDIDRTQIMDYTNYSKSQAGRLAGDNLWSRGREGARKTNVHLAFTDIAGNLDRDGLKKFVSKKNSGSWNEYTKDAFEKMSETGVLQELARERVTRQIMINTLSSTSGPSTGAEQQEIITNVLRETGPVEGVNNDPTT